MPYAFANRSLIREDELLDVLYSAKTKFKSPIVNEVQIGSLLLLGAYSYFAYKPFS